MKNLFKFVFSVPVMFILLGNTGCNSEIKLKDLYVCSRVIGLDPSVTLPNIGMVRMHAHIQYESTTSPVGMLFFADSALVDVVGENEPVYCATVLETPDQNLTLAEVTRIASIDIIFTPNPDVEPVSLQLKGFSETGSMTTSDGLRLSNSDGSPLVYLEGRVGINNSVFGNFSEPLEVYVRKDAQVNIDDSERSENEIEFDAEFIESELSSANRQ